MFALACAAADRALAQQAQARPEVREVRFPGAESLPRSVLLEATATQPTSCRGRLVVLFCAVGADWALDRKYLPDSAEVRLDAERIATLYEAWGYPQAEVSHRIEERSGDVVEVEFAVTEGPPLLVESIALRGVETLTPHPRLDRLPLRVGEPYALPRVRATEQYIQDVLAEQGRPHAAVTFGGAVDEARLRANLVLEVEPGPTAVFGEAEVEAAAPLSERLVRERLAFRPGQPFRTSALEETERSLYALPIVGRAVVSAVTTAGEREVTPLVMVETRRRRAIEAEGTISSVDCLELGTFWRDRYFLGGPRMLALGVALSNLLATEVGGSFPCSSAGTGEYAEPNYRLSAELWQPWFGNARTTLMLRGFAHRETSPRVYVQEGAGGEVAVGRDVGRGGSIQLGYAPERHSLSAVALYFCGGYGICDAAAIGRMSGSQWLAPLQLMGAWRSPGADRFQRPPSGLTEFDVHPPPSWRHNARLIMAAAGRWSGSDYGFRRALAEVGTARVLGRDLEIGARLRGGAVFGDAVLPPQLRLFSGGVATVRGTEQNLVGPQVLLLEGDAPTCAPTCMLEGLDPDRLTVRPTGGDRLVEANLEVRYWLTDALQVAAFVDYGRLSRSSGPLDSPRSDALLSPGVGVRLITDLGPIRLDIGYDGRGPRTHPLYSGDEAGGLVRVGNARHDPFGWDGATGLRSFLRRLQLHMAIGQVF